MDLPEPEGPSRTRIGNGPEGRNAASSQARERRQSRSDSRVRSARSSASGLSSGATGVGRGWAAVLGSRGDGPAGGSNVDGFAQVV